MEFTIFNSVLQLVPSVAATLFSGWNYTLLVPTDEAFFNLPNGTIEFLTADENIDTLTDILNYHIITKVLPSPLIVDETVGTVQGSTIDVTVGEYVSDSQTGIFFNTAQVVDADVLANNGIIHIIDAVLIPPIATPAPTEKVTEPPVRSPRAAPSRF
jgi:uncharacterized surface protein with fasciclin (FAS1) repeats